MAETQSTAQVLLYTHLRGNYVQFLEIAIGDVVAAPVGDRIELQAVGELHLVGLAKPLELLPSPSLALSLSFSLFCSSSVTG